MAGSPVPIDHTDRLIAEAHAKLDEHARLMRRDRLWCKIQITIDGEDGRAIGISNALDTRRLARNL